ncbi:ABC transporter ATP-binding protein [Streptomyces odontomachi]|uniref:ABC transporter ATP-binding protein n=1 Tax=Streptomyces odontomachi TaxID=2944940 RepID=UPI0021089DA3|nr:ABC transporter ATP-binding protein [Streptomyces sp. ODS25]
MISTAAHRLRRLQDLREMTRAVPRVLLLCALTVNVVAGALPIVFLVGIGRAVGDIHAGQSPNLHLAIAVGAFTAQQVLSSSQLVVAAAVTHRINAHCSAEVLRLTLGAPSLSDLEGSDLADDLHAVCEPLEAMTNTPGDAFAGALFLIARYTQLGGAAAILSTVVGPGTAAVVVTAALVARTGHANAFRKWGKIVSSLRGARRAIAYLRDLGMESGTAKEIRIFRLGPWIERKFAAHADRFNSTQWAGRSKIYGRPFAAYSIFVGAGLIGSLVLFTNQPSMDPSRAVIALQAVVLCGRFGTIFPESDTKLVYGFSAWESLTRAKRRFQGPETTNGKQPAVPDTWHRLTLENVGFSYTGNGVDVLKSVNLDIPAGTSLAVVGVNGAGKTTLTKIITGLYQPTSGSIRFVPVDPPGADILTWQNQFAVAFQNFSRFPFSLRENVTIGSATHNADDADVLEAIGLAGLGPLVGALPAGLDTPLDGNTEGGVDVSGGQWQRIALARSLFAIKNGRKVLVLDEPTAQLDARGEADFYDRFLELTKGTTSIVISHRFSTVRRADQIAVLDGGFITERGSHEELMRLGGLYAKMFHAQAERYQCSETGGEQR